MKKHIFFIIFVFLPLMVWADFFPGATPQLEERKIWMNVSMKPNSNSAVVHFRVWFEAPPDKVYQVLIDTNNFKNALNNYKDSRALSKEVFKKISDAKPKSAEDVVALIGQNKFESDYNRQKGQNWTDYIYYQFNFPWPLTDRWVVQKVHVDETNASQGEYKYDYKMEVGNFNTLSGFWRLKPVPGHDGWTEFYGRYESDSGVAVPNFVIKKGVRSGLKKDIASYRQILQK